MLLSEKSVTEIARGVVSLYVSLIFMLLRENKFTEIAWGGVFP